MSCVMVPFSVTVCFQLYTDPVVLALYRYKPLSNLQQSSKVDFVVLSFQAHVESKLHFHCWSHSRCHLQVIVYQEVLEVCQCFVNTRGDSIVQNFYGGVTRPFFPRPNTKRKKRSGHTRLSWDGCEWLHSFVVLNKGVCCKFQPV